MVSLAVRLLGGSVHILTLIVVVVAVAVAELGWYGT